MASKFVQTSRIFRIDHGGDDNYLVIGHGNHVTARVYWSLLRLPTFLSRELQIGRSTRFSLTPFVVCDVRFSCVSARVYVVVSVSPIEHLQYTTFTTITEHGCESPPNVQYKWPFLGRRQLAIAIIILSDIHWGIQVTTWSYIYILQFLYLYIVY